MFTWIPIYKEPAKALLLFRNRQPDRVQILDQIKKTDVPIIRLIDAPKPAVAPPLAVIDPFTFFCEFEPRFDSRKSNRNPHNAQIKLSFAVPTSLRFFRGPGRSWRKTKDERILEYYETHC